MKRQLSFFSSLFAVLIYALCTIISLVKFPTAYSPLKNWLSDLGSRPFNPQGWIFYNFGIVATSLLLLSFFFGLSVWNKADNKKQRIMLKLAQVFGCLGALSMLMSAVFPINIPGIHSIFSAALYILIGTAFVFSVVSLLYYAKFPKWIFVVGILIAVEDMLWGMVLNIYIMEWITVGLLLFFTLLLGLQTRIRQNNMSEE